MNNLEKQLHRQLENQLSKKGLFQSQWAILENLRRKNLIEQGENPEHYNIGDKYCSKKIQFKK